MRRLRGEPNYIWHRRGCPHTSPILCAAHTDPYILEQAYEQDEAGLEEQPIDCTGDPLDDDEWDMGYDCSNSLNDEPTIAGEVTGYDNGPTFW
jgi:hypothetical protein